MRMSFLQTKQFSFMLIDTIHMNKSLSEVKRQKQLIDDWSRLGPVRLPPAEDHADQHRHVLHPLAHRARNNSLGKNITS